MEKNKLKTSLVAGSAALIGIVGSIAAGAHAQTPVVPPIVPTTTIQATSATQVQVDQPESANDPTDSPTAADKVQGDKPESANDPADTDTESEHHGHRPLGGDGVV